MDADGSNEIRLTIGPEDRKPAWSPDGSRIAYWSKVDEDWYICVMNVDGSGQIRLVKAGDENGTWGFVWSPK
jgi:Tol biopolymer transport system component